MDMKKQKLIPIVVLWIFLISAAWCSKSTSTATENEITPTQEENTILEPNNWEEEIWIESNETTDNETNAEEDTTPISNEWRYEYESKMYNFTISIPNQWNFVENEHGFSVIVYTPEDWDLRENLWITIQTPQIDTDLEEYYKDSMQKIDGISEWFKEIKTTDIEINGIKGKSTIYETVENDTNIQSQQTVLIKNNIVYVLQYTATKETFDKYINEINNIIKSFTILN